MIYNDRLWGWVKIAEPDILALINSSELQRLKKIDQAGYFEPYSPKSKYSRFEHSLGCYILLKKAGAGKEEQIMGLIHDVSHSAFSHCVDYVLAEGSPEHHSHQDNIFKNFVLSSGLPKIFKKHSLNLKNILNEQSFPLQESDLPNLCADRIDYSLRGLVVYNKIKTQKAQEILADLLVINKQWVFKSQKIAKQYALLFSFINQKYYSGLNSAKMFCTVSEYLKRALEKKYITKKDLYATDREVIRKINKYLKQDEQLKNFWLGMNNKLKIGNSLKNFTSEIICKSRAVDPLFLKNNCPVRLSDTWPKWKERVRQELKPKKYYLKLGASKA